MELDTAFVIWLLGSLVAAALVATLVERYVTGEEDQDNE